MIDLQNVIALAVESANIDRRIDEVEHPDDPGTKVPVILVTDAEGGTSPKLAEEILGELDKRAPGPRRRTGTVTLTEVGSLIEYMKRYQGPDTVAYANTKAVQFTVVFDEHPAGASAAGAKAGAGTAWREHRAVYTCPKSPEWLAWSACDGKAMRQEEFADFLEARLEDMAIAADMPKPVEVLKVARELHIRTKGTFQREVNPTTGDSILVNKNETESGSTVIPRAFALAIPVFEGGERYHVEARVRFQLTGSGPMFSYTMHRRAEIERDAFDGVRKIIATATERPVFAGTP